MTSGRIDDLARIFGHRTAAAIAEAYEAATSAATIEGISTLSSEVRIEIVHALLKEAKGGWVDAHHLKTIALDLVAAEETR